MIKKHLSNKRKFTLFKGHTLYFKIQNVLTDLRNQQEDSWLRTWNFLSFFTSRKYNRYVYVDIFFFSEILIKLGTGRAMTRSDTTRH